jgi:hypothetical protein
MMMRDAWIWTETAASKLGRMLAGYPAQDPHASCQAVRCPLRRKADGGDEQCFAHAGRVAMAGAAMRQRAAAGRDYSAATVGGRAGRDIVRARVAMEGDPLGSPEAAESTLRDCWNLGSYGITTIGYTAGWDSHDVDHPTWNEHRVRFAASCQRSIERADLAIAKRWDVATIVVGPGEPMPERTPNGHRVALCPAQAAPGRVTCGGGRGTIACGGRRGALCSPRAGRRPFVVAFRDHGPASRRKGGE